MIKGIVGCKVMQERDLEPVLVKLKSHAAQYQGFQGVERLISEDNASLVAMVSTWDTVEDWKSWARSTITQDLLREAGTFLAEEPRVTTYRLVPSVTWV
jgi:heme-degrading monooxygenase HmoA